MTDQNDDQYMRKVISEIGKENRCQVCVGLQGGADSVSPLEKHPKGLGVIRGATIMQGGFVKDDRGWEIDDTTLSQLVETGNSLNQGQKSRFGHPSMSSSALGTFLGRFHNMRKEGNKVVGDLFFDHSAHNTPQGDIAKYVMDFARSDPDAFGVSIAMLKKDLVFREDTKGNLIRDEATGEPLPPLLRIEKLAAIDIVDDPAACDGLFEQNGFYTDQVKLSSEVASLLDKILDNPKGIEVINNFLHRYLQNHKGQNMSNNELGRSLAALLNGGIDRKTEAEEKTREEVVSEMATAAGIESDTVNQILSGSINCPPVDRLRSFSRVLDISLERMLAAGNEDGCEYNAGGEENDNNNNSKHIKEDDKLTYEEGVKEGAKLERERIQSVEAQSLPGFESIVDDMKFDGVSTGAEVAIKIIKASQEKAGIEKESVKQAGKDLQNESVPPVDIDQKPPTKLDFTVLTKEYQADHKCSKIDAMNAINKLYPDAYKTK